MLVYEVIFLGLVLLACCHCPRYVSQSHVLLGAPPVFCRYLIVHALLVLLCHLECYHLCRSRLNA
uniref:Secreted peptide n=1 Tax=Arundo donax TaxID=35708 RepID=A0A0A8YTF1_ARUDO